MAFFEWSKEFDVGVFAMNRQHQGLIALMNQLHELHISDGGYDQVVEVLDELGAKTTEHFAVEERFMESIDYPKLSAHRWIHKRLLEQYGEHVAAFRASRDLTSAFIYFLRSWLGAHIKGVDQEYGFYARVARTMNRM